ncbi:glutathione S-transferase family protein [Phreatobacter stygius]|uniref:Glutathione S-transferase n=1 Tax=Phreatobacter stygius TaxID=1940610 RepID=A0A4D7B6R4_9HYPH|nr:glutathione S-transferase N-terminal domain-containing protein [Phreatobacter stygius]QCI65396.1 glutathione S-transferase [Phreatobacter stygius]
MLKIWGRDNSANVQKVMWCVGELGLAHERIDAGRQFGVVNEPHYRARNPNGRVPTVEDEGVVLWESNAVCRHLARKHGRLMPAALADKARVDMWMDWQQTEAMTALTPVFWGLVRTAPDQRDHAAIQDGTARSIAAMTILDAELGRHSHVVGHTFSVADIPLGVMAFRYYGLIPDAPKLVHLDRWYALMLQRPAFRRHVADIPLT